MTVVVKQLSAPGNVPTAQTTIYTAVNVTASVDKCTLTNTTSAAITVSVNIVAASGAVNAANTIISGKNVAAGETYLCPEMIGQVLSIGSFISIIASATGLTCAVSGREIS